MWYSEKSLYIHFEVSYLIRYWPQRQKQQCKPLSNLQNGKSEFLLKHGFSSCVLCQQERWFVCMHTDMSKCVCGTQVLNFVQAPKCPIISWFKFNKLSSKANQNALNIRLSLYFFLNILWIIFYTSPLLCKHTQTNLYLAPLLFRLFSARQTIRNLVLLWFSASLIAYPRNENIFLMLLYFCFLFFLVFPTQRKIDWLYLTDTVIKLQCYFIRH